MEERDQNLCTGTFAGGHNQCPFGNGAADHRLSRFYDLAGEAAASIEAQSLAGGRIGNELHFVRGLVVAREPHVLPRNQFLCDWLDSLKASLDAGVRRYGLRQPVDQTQPVCVNGSFEREVKRRHRQDEYGGQGLRRHRFSGGFRKPHNIPTSLYPHDR